jgi:hypothetical protein
MNNRIELKATLRSTDIDILENWIISKTTLSSFFPARRINNIYFESYSYDSVVDNINGISNRTKVRYRWYGESNSNISDGTLEFKRKKNNEGWKNQYNVSLQSGKKERYTDIVRDIMLSIPIDKQLEFSSYSLPFVLNNYYREYYCTVDKKIRVTIDRSIRAFDQRWSSYVSRKKKIPLPDIVIVEFKLDPNDKPLLNSLIKDFPFRISKHSKYVTSVLHN